MHFNVHCELPLCSASVRMLSWGFNLGLPSSSFRPALPHQRWLVVVWLAVVSSADGLYAVALWRGCHGTSASAWGPFWPPMPRPCLLLPRPPGEGGVGFT